MIIRNATPEDIPAIVALLQLSLGESLIKKSSRSWNYKHVDNPFGVSQVLLAFENDVLVGVRAFMKWQWNLGSQSWTAFRAVDTATHPNYQGKGIFKKLTLQALDEIQKEGETFVFNTPNNNSRPGYLKMGWQIVDAIELAVVPTLMYSMPYFFFKVKTENAISTAQLNQLCIGYNLDLSKKKILFTPKSVAYLKWRYEVNPLQDYVIFSTNDWYMVFYIKKHRFFNELRVVETIGSNQKQHLKQMKKNLLGYAFHKRCWFITTANKDLFRCKIYGKFGPKLTIKTLTKNSLFINTVYTIQKWRYSLGDLELF
jgi:N-acetylglutamate synthase-like GNAT family acetyltransferase